MKKFSVILFLCFSLFIDAQAFGVEQYKPYLEDSSNEAVLAVVPIPSGGWYVGGAFKSFKGVPRNRLARINADGSLHAFNPNMNDNVTTLVLDGSGNLYAGGLFTAVGGDTTRKLLCKFDNTGTLTSFKPNINAAPFVLKGIELSYTLYKGVYALALDASGNLYVGGTFSMVGSSTRNYLCKFDNTGALTPFNPNIIHKSNVNVPSTQSRFPGVYALAVDGSGNLYTGGIFSTVGNSPRNYLCKFDNTGALTSFDPNMNHHVYALALDGSSNLYVGGGFTSVGGTLFTGGGGLGSPTGTPIRYDNIYLNTGGSTRSRLCKFDKTGTLTPFNPTMNDAVYALALDGSGNLYVGGRFSTVGGTSPQLPEITSLIKDQNTGEYTLRTLSLFPPFANDASKGIARMDQGGGMLATERIRKAAALKIPSPSLTTVGGSTRNGLCKFDNTGTLTSFNPDIKFVAPPLNKYNPWWDFGSPIDFLYVQALALGSGNVFVGGNFMTPSANSAIFPSN